METVLVNANDNLITSVGIEPDVEGYLKVTLDGSLQGSYSIVASSKEDVLTWFDLVEAASE